MSLNDRLIDFQNESEAEFEKKKTFKTVINYILAFGLFMLSTLVAGFRMPFAKLSKAVRKPAEESFPLIRTIDTANIEETFAQNEYVLIDFWAEWCGPCIMMEPILKEYAKDAAPIIVGKVDADANAALLKRFNVMGLPQILLFKNGKEINRNVGPLSLSGLRKFGQTVMNTP